MTSFFLYNRREIVADSLPTDVTLTRFAFAINLLVVVNAEGKLLQLIDSAPSKLKTWFPFFHSISGSIDTSLNKPRQAIDYMSSMEAHLGGRQQLIAEAASAFKDAFISLDPDSTLDLPDIDNVFIRFSQSAKTWTLYKNIYAVTVVPPNRLEQLRNASIHQTFLSLSSSAIETSLIQGIDGKPIIDNIVSLLQNDSFVQMLQNL